MLVVKLRCKNCDAVMKFTLTRSRTVSGCGVCGNAHLTLVYAQNLPDPERIAEAPQGFNLGVECPFKIEPHVVSTLADVLTDD